MGKVQLLDEVTINRIAAGEVVERPASAVKELLENSIDAGAKRITVEIVRGGKSSLRVVDDGEGMSKEDALLALERHATSKIRSGDPLLAVHTMGFRGEALPAIAGVSKMTLTTRARGAAAGTQIEIQGGTIRNVTEHGGPEGTAIHIRDLYFNTPARKKFLKGDGPETAAVSEVVMNAMLASPEVAFKLVAGGETHLMSPGDGRRTTVARQLFGIPSRRAQGGDELVEVDDAELPDLPYRVSAVLSRPQFTLPTRRGIRFFVNGRPIRSPGLARAVQQAYRSATFVGRSPLALVFLQAPPSWVDVNVHPAKLEVRFQEGHRLEEALADRLRQAIQGRVAPRELLEETDNTDSNGNSNGQVGQAPEFVETVERGRGRGPWPARGESPRAQSRPGGPRDRDVEGTSLFAAPTKPAKSTGSFDPLANSAAARARAGVAEPVEEMREAGDHARFDAAKTPAPDGTACAPGAYPDPAELAADRLPGTMLAEGATMPDWAGMEIIGQSFDTYILGVSGGMLFIVDQHAAHERILYERALDRLSWKDLPVQRLLFPVTIELPRDSASRIEERLPLLQQYGFQAEIYSGNTLVVSTVPTLSDRMNPELLLRDLVAELDGLSQRFSADDTLRSLAATIACRSAVMAGERLDVPSMGNLVGDLARARQPMTCAHGRPSVLTVSAHDLDRRFLRCK